SLVLGHGSQGSLHVWIEDRLLALRGADEANQRAIVVGAWRELDERGRLVWNKLLMGGLRAGVAQSLLVRALADVSGLDQATIAHRLAGDWEPTPTFYASLLGTDTRDADSGRPYPFFLAHPLEGEPEALGDIAEWQIERKWDGVRAQLIHREQGT